jgi:uncharacterized membrane protein YecN with MAPEG domain
VEKLLGLNIVPLYGALLTILFLILSVRTLLLRKKYQLGVGDGGNMVLKRAARAHANFAEYAPLALILLSFCEVWSAPSSLLHGLGVSLLIGRSLHAFGISQPQEDFRFRVAGMILTLSTIGICAGFILYQGLDR